MKEIELSRQGKNKGKYVALVDDEYFEMLNQFRWYAHEDGNALYAMRMIRVGGKQKCVMMHCDIIGKKGVDHIDHDGLNNQLSNLRLCTNSENAMNRRKKKGCASAHKGVSLNKQNGKWRAQIMIDGKRVHLGYFISEASAACAYNKKALEVFGGFANLNNLNELK